jgi:hypothetical protein
MTKDDLVSAVKAIISQARGGDVEGSYRSYKELFLRPGFTSLRPEDQRQALKLLVLAKRTGAASADLKEAHRAALGALTELVSNLNEPEDYEMLGMCHLLVGNEQAASNIFKAGLQIERERNAQSDLCGRLMTRLSSI